MMGDLLMTYWQSHLCVSSQKRKKKEKRLGGLGVEKELWENN